MGKLSMPTKDNYPLELLGAVQTLSKGMQIRDTIVAPRAQSDLVYWFAELYHYITTFEIEDRAVFERPYFVMHFIPIFYDMYAEAANRFIVKGKAKRAEGAADTSKDEPIPINWQGHFAIASLAADPTKDIAHWMAGVTQSIISGVSAHINGDMAKALEQAWRTFDAKYTGVPKLDAFHADFFEKNKPIFEKVRKTLINEVVNRGTGIAMMMRGTVNPNFASDMDDKLNMGLNIDEIYKWREEAWQTAKKALNQK